MLAASFAATGLISAQAPAIQPRPPDKNASQVMITSCKSAEKGPKSIGLQAGEDLRSKVERNLPFREVYVIPVTKINPNLEASGFAVSEGLQPHDAKQLATMLRSDEYITCEAARAGTGFKTSADLVLTRDLSLRQPLGNFDTPKLGDGLDGLVKEYKEARKQLAGEKGCTAAARDKKYPDAIAAANAGIALYPKATLARMCKMSVLDVMGAKPEEVLAVAREIVAIDPKSSPALRVAVKEFQALKQDDSVGVALVKLLATDPTNSALAQQVIETLFAMKNIDFAKPIVDQAIEANPGDPDLLKFKWIILYSSKSYKDMYALGEEIAKLDTSFTDSTYFARTAQAYANDSLFQKSAEMSAKALAKYPNNAFFTGFEIQSLQKAGQQQQALDKLDKAIAAKVPVENAGTMRLLMLRDLNRNDEVIPSIRALIAAGDTSSNLRSILFAQAAEDQKAALAKAASGADTVTVYRNSLALLAYADSNIAMKSPQHAEAQFRLGNANFQLVRPLLLQAVAEKSCPLAKEANDHIVNAQIMLPQGGAQFADIMKQLMQGAMTYQPVIDQTIKGLCK